MPLPNTIARPCEIESIVLRQLIKNADKKVDIDMFGLLFKHAQEYCEHYASKATSGGLHDFISSIPPIMFDGIPMSMFSTSVTHDGVCSRLFWWSCALKIVLAKQRRNKTLRAEIDEVIKEN